MKRLLSVISIGLLTFVVVTASAAGLGTGPSARSLSAAADSVVACGNPGSITVSYTLDTGGTNVNEVLLTASTTDGTAWSGGPTTCMGKTAYITLGSNATEAIAVDSSSGTGNRVLTFNVSDVAVTSVTTFAIVIQGAR